MLLCISDAVRTVLRLDPTLDLPARTRIVNVMLKAAKNQSDVPSTQPVQRLIRREEVARRLSVTARTVDRLSTDGVLQKIRFPGRDRGGAFRESDVTDLINSLRQQTKTGTARISERERYRALRKLCVELIEHYRGITGLELKGPMFDTITKISEMIGEPMC